LRDAKNSLQRLINLSRAAAAADDQWKGMSEKRDHSQLARFGKTSEWTDRVPANGHKRRAGRGGKQGKKGLMSDCAGGKRSYTVNS
jgi:hypothetical protein